MNPDLVQERLLATFDCNKVTYMLDGCIEKTKRRRYLQLLIERDPTGIFDNTFNNYLHRTERHTRALAKHVRLIELCRQINIGSNTNYNGHILQDPDFITLVASVADDLPTALHWIMFVPNIISLCTDEQQSEFLPLIRDWKMIGCYAQTELGHGSNVRALETTATFGKDDDDGHFIINSPTITSAKFWPGTLGRTANYAMVIARLIDGTGIDRGIHNFLVPLRSLSDHTLLPGVCTGDLGPKIGYNGMDNGFAMFTNVRIPRRYMAMKFASVDTNGTYTVKRQTDASSKVAYITMMQVRSYIVNEAGKNLAAACCIVIRYSAVRRQGYTSITNDNNTSSSSSNSSSSNSTKQQQVELQILDYKQQQHRILPLLASSYCFFFMGKQLLKRLKEIEDCLLNNKPVMKEEVTDIHATTSALKSYTTIITANGIEECRKACGGHGYLMCSGLPELFTTYLQNPTVEGDNHMLPQQVMKVLLKLAQVVVDGNQTKLEQKYNKCASYMLVPSMQAILLAKQQQDDDDTSIPGETCNIASVADLMEYQTLLVPAFRHRAARLLLEVAQLVQTNIASRQKSFEQAWNDSLIEMARCSRAYSQYLLLVSFINGIEQEAATGTTIGTAEVTVLYDLVRLLGMYWIEQDIGDYLEDGYMTQKQASTIRHGVVLMLDRIRPNAVALVDSWDISDYRLKNSALGRYDGNVYEAILQSSQRDPLNQSEPGPGYTEHLKRLIVDGVGEYKKEASTTTTTKGISGTASRL